MMLWLRAAVFTVALPGTVTVLAPFFLLWRGSWPPPISGWRGCGLVPLAAGVALYFVCLREFVMRGRGTPAPWDPPRALVRRGPYAWTRNPMYVGILAVLAGEAILGASVVLIAYAAAMGAAFHLRVVTYEEPVLERTFGDEWLAYRAAVPRWAGRPGRSG